MEPRAFVAATAIGTVIWNMPFLTLGYALRGSSHDPVGIGFWVAAILIAVEVAIILGLRLYKRPIASPSCAATCSRCASARRGGCMRAVFPFQTRLPCARAPLGRGADPARQPSVRRRGVRGRHRGAQLALLIFAVGVDWHRSIFRRRANRDVTKVVAGLAEAAAMAFLRERRDGDRPAQRPDAARSLPRDVIRVRSLFISDIHLGTRGCQAEMLLDFLRYHDAETIYLVGDIVDGWRLRSSWYWPQAHNDVVQKLLRKARKGTGIVYIPGNHDEFLRDYLGIEFRRHRGRRARDPRGGRWAATTWSSMATSSTSWCATRNGSPMLGDWAYTYRAGLNTG